MHGGKQSQCTWQRRSQGVGVISLHVHYTLKIAMSGETKWQQLREGKVAVLLHSYWLTKVLLI